ncbi:radical SAM protein [bacterium]|nr:MAG: radical SAM protein [bacterium]
MRFLLVNPWIADVAAYNFWLRPLGLYRLAEWLFERGAEFTLIDALSPFPAPGKFTRRKNLPLRLPEGAPENFSLYGISPEEFERRIRAAGPFDAALVTSALSYWYPGAEFAIRTLKRLSPKTPVILGGVYPTLWPGHARANSGADFTLSGPLSVVSDTLAGLLGVPKGPLTEKKRWYDLGLHDNSPFSAVRTARGCPYSCTYCASRLVSGPFYPYSAEDCAAELKALATLGVKEAAFYDDALLVNAENRFLPLMEEVKGLGLSFHTPNGLHAKLVDEKIAAVFAENSFKTIRLSLETVDESRQKATGGKVSATDLEKAVKNLKRAGVKMESVGVYLLMGLPGQSIAEIEDSIRWVKSLGVRPHLAEYSPIPSTPDFERLKDLGLLPENLDPLFTNNSLYCERFGHLPKSEIQRLKSLSRSK